MDQNGILYQSLRDQIDKLEQRCSRAEADLAISLKLFRRHSEWAAKEFKVSCQEHYDSLDRIRQLESKVFPNLAIGLELVRRIIGEPEVPYENPLDRKKI